MNRLNSEPDLLVKSRSLIWAKPNPWLAKAAKIIIELMRSEGMGSEGTFHPTIKLLLFQRKLFRFPFFSNLGMRTTSQPKA